VWAELYLHWKSLNEGLNKPNKDSGNGERENNVLSSSSDVRQSAVLLNCFSFCGRQDFRAEWQNTTLFLASLGGCCILDGAPPPHPLSKWCQADLMPPELKTPIAAEDLIKRFIITAVDMLIHEDILTRETAKEALGPESHPKLYPLLVAQLDT
jgi:hypothetical protein